MATAKDFVARIDKIEGVAGCLLMKTDGTLIDQTLEDAATYASLMAAGRKEADSLMRMIGCSDCQHICFGRADSSDFYVFPIENFMLGIVQQTNCDTSDMLDTVYGLIDRVSTRRK
ncbi:MAG: hypothetical protein C0622_13295 [Desulfuromonas sp.]|nr:MAG: hypothetical protein C0622_13295 [Desulfuromonas sp.]